MRDKSTLPFITGRPQTTNDLEHTWTIRGMKVLENPSNCCWKIPEKVLCSLRTVPLITDQSQTKLRLL
jgi:hypothetical protein